MDRLEGIHEEETRRLVFLGVDQQLGEPVGIGARVKASDQRGAVGVGSRQDVEQLASADLADGCNDA